MQQQPVTDLELVDALAQRRRGAAPLASQSFTVHELFIYNQNPSDLYSTYGGGAAGSSGGCVYFFSEQVTSYYQDGWRVVAGTQEILDGGGAVVGLKDTLAFHEGRWLPRTHWAMDEFYAFHQEGFKLSRYNLRLYRLRRLDG